MQFQGMEIITNNQDDNLGGVATLRFAPGYFFSSLNPLTFNTGYDWISIEVASETVSFTEKASDSVNLTYQDTQISHSLPKIRPEVHAILNKYRGQRCVVECEDNNGYLRRAGVSGLLTLLDQNATGQQVSDTNGYGLTFAGQSLLPAEFI